jgi:threonine/homoserine/homoserine lactone efflux protein
MTFSTLWIVFSLSFVLALSGALMPGPLLTYTIARTMQSWRGGWLTGARVTAGHAALEGLLLCGLVLGVVEFLRAPLAAKIIGIVGAVLLAYMGVGLIREVVRGNALPLSAGDTDGRQGTLASRMSPVLAGALVSMSNPYWWIWWVTIGSAFLVRFDITLGRWQAILAFFLGHELGDLGWYMAVSTLLHLGKRAVPRAVIGGLLAVCGVAIIGFGAYLGIAPFLAR